MPFSADLAYNPDKYGDSRLLDANILAPFLHLSKPSGEGVARSDQKSGNGAFLASFFSVEDFVREDLKTTLPATIAPGQYDLFAGLDRRKTGMLLRTEEVGSIKMGTITVNLIRGFHESCA
ncbi:MAG: hypothetical protein Q7O66_14700 [Dehalococcoidia bacterium]|nr:hypothetical protein [Dehalococcoidia bacterium]